MVFVALLRGINVGGNNKVEMARLKITFERLGFINVKTHINSGNVIFTETHLPAKTIAAKVEEAILKDFGFAVSVLVRSIDNIRVIEKSIPKNWVNNDAMKCDVMFLWDDVANPEVLKQLIAQPEIEDLRYLTDVLVWRINRDSYYKSKVPKVIGTKLYKRMTIRNINTLRKLILIADGQLN